MAISKKKRMVLYDRDGERCAACGGHVLTVQHRKNRGAGGSALLDGFSNLLSLCWHCNTRLESDALFARKGRAYGWKLESWENPLAVAVYYAWAGVWRYLDDLGQQSLAEGRSQSVSVQCEHASLMEACGFVGEVALTGAGVWSCPRCGWDNAF